MNSSDLKKYIFENNKIEFILEEIGCHSIKWHGTGYWTCGNPDGDNNHAITVYADEYLRVINYTRQISSNPSLSTDIINLVEFNKNLSFFHAIKWLCNLLGLDYYAEETSKQYRSLQILQEQKDLRSGYNAEEDNKPLKPIPEIILTYYRPWVNDLFKKDNIPYSVQREWEIGYDEYSNRITIPIRDEIGNLVGVKGRIFAEELSEWEKDYKYMYIEPCPRGKILYGLNKTDDFIKKANKVLVGESEKSVMQMWAYGHKNCVATSGTKISRKQVEKLSRISPEIYFCFDKDVTKQEIEHIANLFVDGVSIYYLWDDQNLLEEKESPSDNPEKFEKLLENAYKIK